jgi:hypothetical protein
MMVTNTTREPGETEAATLVFEGDFQLEVSGITEANTMVAALLPLTAVDNVPEAGVGRVMSFDLVSEEGAQVTEGFSFQFTIPKSEIPGVGFVNLYRRDEVTGLFADTGIPVSDGGTEWIFSLQSFSVYVLVDSTSENSGFSSSGGGGGGGGCLLNP